MNREQLIALRDAHGATAEDSYFKARPAFEGSSVPRRRFNDGFVRGFDAAVEALRDVSWAPAAVMTIGGEPLQGLAAYLHALAKDSVSATNRDTIYAWAREIVAIEARSTAPAAAAPMPVREALAKLETEMGSEIDRLREEVSRLTDAGAEQAQHIRSLEDYSKKLEAERPQIATLVDRFLGWPLPQTVCTDAYTHVPSSVRRADWSASGTNLLSATEAEAMFKYVLEGRYVPRPAAPAPAGTWVDWAGGVCPLPHPASVEIKLRNGATGVERAGSCRWDRFAFPDDGDIMAYRVVP